MPGAFAHITLVNLLKEPQRLEAIRDFPEAAIPAVLDYFSFCELGAVSPDYPYLALGDKEAARWADAMHYERTGEMIHAGIHVARELDGDAKQIALAWLLGYTAHVGTDVTIHPVVERKVGPYAQNKDAHRICEMHQDAYIFQRLNLGDIGLSEHLDSGICSCGSMDSLHPVIRDIWQQMMKGVHTEEHWQNAPDPDKWHVGFRRVVDIAEEGNRLMPIARHVAADCGFTYPAQEDVDQQFIENLRVPTGYMHYDQIFDAAVNNVTKLWAVVARGVLLGDEAYRTEVANWNLDTGRDANGKLVLWS
jgi:hypothetical protein